MLNDSLLGLPSYISATIVEHLSARDLCTLAQVWMQAWAPQQSEFANSDRKV